jgi:hypothetical protein
MPVKITVAGRSADDVLICRILLFSSSRLTPGGERNGIAINHPAGVANARISCGVTSELPQAIIAYFYENLPARAVILPRFPVFSGQRELFQDQRGPSHASGLVSQVSSGISDDSRAV